MGGLCCSNPSQTDLVYEQAAGHKDSLKYNGHKVQKETKASEADTYQQIFDDTLQTSLKGMRPFVPKLYNVKNTIDPDKKEIVI